MQGYGGSDDWIVMPLQCVTQWDSLAHIFYEGKMWNGYDAALVTSSGAAKNSIDKTKDKIAGRGVLLDVARHKGVRRSSPATRSRWPTWRPPPRPAVEVQRGDILLVRTGHMSRTSTRTTGGTSTSTRPGRLRAHDAVAARHGRSRPSQRQLRGGGPALGDRGFRSPFHVCAIPNMGLTLGEIFFLEDLAADCAADGRYAFLLVAPPLPVTGGGHADQSLRHEVVRPRPTRGGRR